MKYVICNKDKALAAGFHELGHKMKGTMMLLNEREVIISPRLSGTLEERASALGGRTYSRTGVFHYVKQNKWE